MCNAIYVLNKNLYKVLTTKRQLSREGREGQPSQPNINISIEQPVEVGGAGWSRVLLCVAGGGVEDWCRAVFFELPNIGIYYGI